MTDTLFPRVPEEHPERHQPLHQETRGLWIFIGAFLLFGLLVLIGLYALLGYYRRLDGSLRHPPAILPARGDYPEPRIQGVPGYHSAKPQQDMAEFLEGERRVLGTYGATTQPGFARIPIHRAIELALEKELFPVRPGPTTSPSLGRVVWPPGRSNP